MSQHLFVYSNVGSSFRSPNVDDLGTLGIVDFRFELPQYGLSPEYSLNKELGVKWKSNRAMATLSGYHNRLTGLITRVKSPSDSLQGYPVYWKQNVGESEIRGAEWDFQLLIGKKSQVKAGAFLPWVITSQRMSRCEEFLLLCSMLSGFIGPINSGKLDWRCMGQSLNSAWPRAIFRTTGLGRKELQVMLLAMCAVAIKRRGCTWMLR